MPEVGHREIVHTMRDWRRIEVFEGDEWFADKIVHRYRDIQERKVNDRWVVQSSKLLKRVTGRFLCVGGPRNGERLTFEESRNTKYVSFNCAGDYGRREGIPKSVFAWIER
jgi:hypothetical protein